MRKTGQGWRERNKQRKRSIVKKEAVSERERERVIYIDREREKEEGEDQTDLEITIIEGSKACNFACLRCQCPL